MKATVEIWGANYSIEKLISFALFLIISAICQSLWVVLLNIVIFNWDNVIRYTQSKSTYIGLFIILMATGMQATKESTTIIALQSLILIFSLANSHKRHVEV